MGGRGASSSGGGGRLGNSAQKSKVQQMLTNMETTFNTIKSMEFSKTTDGNVAYRYSYNGKTVNGAIDQNGTAYRTDEYVNNKSWKTYENPNYHESRKDVTSSTYKKAQSALQKKVDSWFGKR